MSTEKNPEMDNSKDKGNDFEIIDENDMEMVRRGRPSSIDEKIVELYFLQQFDNLFVNR